MENKEYLTIEQENGSINISEEVIASIAALAVQEVDGVVGLYGGIQTELTDRLNKKALNKGVHISVENDKIIISCNITLCYGVSIAEAAKAVQEKVISAVQAMTGLKVEAVNVHVSAISMVKKG